MTNIITGSVFIIPNRPVEFGSLEADGFMAKRLGPAFVEMDPSVDLKTVKCIQVWTHDGIHNGSNWSDHGVDQLKGTDSELREGGKYPAYLPDSILKGKREGDIIEFSFQNYKFQLLCKQQGYRYQGHGKFQDVLEKLGIDEIDIK